MKRPRPSSRQGPSRRRRHRRATRQKTRRAYRQRGGNPITFGIIGIFKNEAMGIREWIEHYIWQGVDKILLLDNNSTDNWRDAIKDIKDIDKYVTVKHAEKIHAQDEHYNTLGWPWLKENNIKVVGILDLDEYMFGTDGKNLKQHVVEIFSAPNRPSRFSCNWTMFGSSGHDKQPASIRKSFTMRMRELGKDVKTIAWVDDIKEGGLHLHTSHVTGNTIECPAGIQLNHYAIQSREFFEKVKMSRGDAHSAKSNSVRDWTYFERYDFKDLEDRKLADITP